MKLFNFSKQQPDNITNKTLLMAIEGLRSFICLLADQQNSNLERLQERSKNMGKFIIDMDKKIDIIQGDNLTLIHNNVIKILRILDDTIPGRKEQTSRIKEMLGAIVTPNIQETAPVTECLKNMENKFHAQAQKDIENYYKSTHHLYKQKEQIDKYNQSCHKSYYAPVPFLQTVFGMSIKQKKNLIELINNKIFLLKDDVDFIFHIDVHHQELMPLFENYTIQKFNNISPLQLKYKPESMLDNKKDYEGYQFKNIFSPKDPMPVYQELPNININNINQKINQLENQIKQMQIALAKPLKHAQDYQSKNQETDNNPKYKTQTFNGPIFKDESTSILNDISMLLIILVEAIPLDPGCREIIELYTIISAIKSSKTPLEKLRMLRPFLSQLTLTIQHLPSSFIPVDPIHSSTGTGNPVNPDTLTTLSPYFQLLSRAAKLINPDPASPLHKQWYDDFKNLTVTTNTIS